MLIFSHTFNKNWNTQSYHYPEQRNLERPVKKRGAIIGMSNDADISTTGKYVLPTQKLSLTLLLDTHSCQKGIHNLNGSSNVKHSTPFALLVNLVAQIATGYHREFEKGPYEVHYTVQKNVSHYSMPSMAD